MRRILGRAIVALAAAITTAAALAPAASAGSGVTLGRYGTAHIDEKISSGEYGSSCVGPTTEVSGGKSYHFTICEQNDSKNIYWAVNIDDPLSTGFDAPMFWFDNNDDGHVAAGATAGGCKPEPAPVEDMFSWSQLETGVYEDGYTCFTATGPHSGLSIGFDPVSQVNGSGGCAPNAANTMQTCEFKKPLRSGDPNDFSLVPGNKLGWCFTYDDRSNPANVLGSGIPTDLQYPFGCWLDKGAHQDTLSGITSRYANAVIYGQIVVISAAVKNQLSKYLASCRFCPPDPTKQLDGELGQAKSALAVGNRTRAVRALRSFVAFLQKLLATRQLPAAVGKLLVSRVQRIISEIEHLPSSRPPPTLPSHPRVSKTTVPVGGG